MKKIISLPYGLVDLAIEQKWTKELAYFCHIKGLYKNGIIYNYTSRKLAEKLDKSHGTVNSHVQYLVSIGLLYLNSGHLICASHKELCEIVSTATNKPTGKGLLKIKIHKKILHTEWNINARVVLNSLNRQKYVSRIKSEVNAIRKKIKANHYVTRKELARYRKLESKLNNSEKGTGENVCYLSDTTVSKLLKGRSISNVREMFSFWVEHGLIKCEFVKGKTLDTHISVQSFLALRDVRAGFERTYLYKGRIIQFNKRAVGYGEFSEPKEVIKNLSRYPTITNKLLERSLDLAKRKEKELAYSIL